MKKDYTPKDLQHALDGAIDWATAEVKCRMTSDCVGGQPATEKTIRAFVAHHLKLTDDDEIEEAVQRILKQEVQDRTPEQGEIKEEEIYQVNVMRANSAGQPYIGTWMIRAMLKQAGTRLHIFQKKQGTKGDMSEGMLVEPLGPSDQRGVVNDVYANRQVVFFDGDNEPIEDPPFERYCGTVTTAQGRKSIVHHSQTVRCTRPVFFSFKLHYPCSKLSAKTMLSIFKMSERVGIGSFKNRESGRFDVVGVTIEMPDKPEVKQKGSKPQSEKDAERRKDAA